MGLPLALPLAPVVAPGASAAAATFVAGSSLALARSVYGFRRETPNLPPLTGLEGVATLQELIADALAGARIPVAMPPSPFGPQNSAAALAAAAALGIWGALRKLPDRLQNLWGWLNGPPSAVLGDPTFSFSGFPASSVSGSFSKTGTTRIVTNLDAQYYKVRENCTAGLWPLSDLDRNIQGGITGLRVRVNTPGAISCGGGYGVSLQYRSAVDGKWKGLTGIEGGWAYNSWYGITGAISLSSTAPDAQPWTDPTQGLPPGTASEIFDWDKALGRSTAPVLPAIAPTVPSLAPPAGINGQPTGVNTSPGIAPALTPPVLNPRLGFGFSSRQNADGSVTQQWVTAAMLPAGKPQGQTSNTTPSTANTSAPAPLPNVFPAYNPAQPTQQVQPDGQIETLPQATPTVTPSTTTVPWPGAAPLNGAALAPAATLVGIAQEVGKIERKIEVMMDPAAPGNLIDRFGDLSDLIGPIVEAILAATSGTTYGLDSPCEVDANGDKLPPVLVEAPGAFTQFGAILNRIDALAELLQVHKNLKQPNCKPKQPTGEFVTVNFEQID